MNARATTVYVVKPVRMTGPYKIGSTNNLTRRFRHICNASPVDMEIVCSMPGDAILERRIHAALLHAHQRCEWFDDCPEVRLLVSQIQSGSFVADHLPPPKGVTSFVRGKPVNRRRQA